MATDNADIARRICEASWRRPDPDIETIMALGDPGHEMFTVQSLVEGGGYRGIEGFREWLLSWSEMFGEEWECHLEEVRKVDDERVLVTAFIHVQGTGGGVPVDQRVWSLMTIRNGRATRSEVYTDLAAALAAAGLSE